MRRTHRFPHLRSNNYPRSPAPARPPSGGHAETPFPFPLPEIRLGQGLMECHALSSGFGFAYEIFRFLLHSPEAIQARTEENPKNVFAPDPETAAPLHLPHPGKTLSSPYGSRRNILKWLLFLWTSFPFRKNNTPEIKNPAPPHGGPGQQNSNSSDYRLADFTIMASLPMRPRR